jgi:hypothetical protein
VRTAQLVGDARGTSWAPFLLERTLVTHSRAVGAWYDRRAGGGAPGAGSQGGNWVAQGVVLGPGPEITKRQVVAVDLTGADGPVVHVRLE